MHEIIRLRDLPGVAELEAALHVPGRQLLKEYDDLEGRIGRLSRRLFGIVEEDTHYRVPHPNGREIVSLTPEQSIEWETW